VDEETMSRVMREMGKRGGKRSLETLTPKERRERARKAGLASGKARAKKAKAKKG
jgi:hypothetical protein